MTGPDDGANGTRPISVAELLAKNGTIGAPPVGGRRRRRRGNSDAVTVAELTGEIPVIRTGEIPVVAEEDNTADGPADDAADGPAQGRESEQATGRTDRQAVSSADTVTDRAAGPVTDRAAGPVTDRAAGPAAPRVDKPEPRVDRRPERFAPRPQVNGKTRDRDDARPVRERSGPPQRSAAPLPRRGDSAPQRSQYPRPLRRGDNPRPASAAPRDAADAELMSPDPIDVEVAATELDLTAAAGVAQAPDELGVGDPSFLGSGDTDLYGGDSLAADLAHTSSRLTGRADEDTLEDSLDLEDTLTGSRGDVGDLEDIDDLDDLDDVDGAGSSRGQLVAHGALVALQSIIAVAFGAGLFIAFDQLWKWNSIVALVLGVLVILGLVVGVRIVRKTEDIGSTLTAVAVGALVTFGPLALLQAN